MYLERAMFVCAPPNSGKSTQIRSMFRDRRLGFDGKVPPTSLHNLPERYALSNERWLYLRLTSPYENNETQSKFHKKIVKKCVPYPRWNFVSAMQPLRANHMPDIVEASASFISYFQPERLRIVFLSPDWRGRSLDEQVSGRDIIRELHQLNSIIEVCCIYARRRRSNGLVLADFFDFT